MSTSFEDRFETVGEITKELKQLGLSKCGLIFAVDYTVSNTIQGKETFNGQSLHHMSKSCINPYEETICTLGEILEPFNEGGNIPAYGFGSCPKTETGFFKLKPEGDCEDFHDVLDAYQQITPTVNLGSPTLFAPLINEAIKIVSETKQYHIMVIISDGQVCDDADTKDAIVKASNYPLSIIVIGVGDGPWDAMERFDDRLPQRNFDNFQFVQFHKVKSESRNPQAAVALATLMEIPDQYAYIKQHGLLENVPSYS